MEPFPTSEQDPTTRAIQQVIETLGGAVGQTVMSAEVHAPAFESSPRPNHVEVPSNIQELLSRGLTDANMTGGSQTDLYRIEGHPGLLARCNQHVQREDLILAYGDARDMGLPVLPAEFVKRKSVTYVITKIVDGAVVDEVLADNPPRALVEAWHQTWAAIGSMLASARQNAAYWATDSAATKQFMWGTLDGDTEPRLWMVDLPTNSYELDNPEVFGMTLLDAIRGLLDAEKALGSEMTLAREQYARAVAQCPDSKSYGNGMRNLASHWLDKGIDTDALARDEPSLAQIFRTN